MQADENGRFANELIACIADGRGPSVQELFAVAKRVGWKAQSSVQSSTGSVLDRKIQSGFARCALRTQLYAGAVTERYHDPVCPADLVGYDAGMVEGENCG